MSSAWVSVDYSVHGVDVGVEVCAQHVVVFRVPQRVDQRAELAARVAEGAAVDLVEDAAERLRESRVDVPSALVLFALADRFLRVQAENDDVLFSCLLVSWVTMFSPVRQFVENPKIGFSNSTKRCKSFSRLCTPGTIFTVLFLF